MLWAITYGVRPFYGVRPCHGVSPCYGTMVLYCVMELVRVMMLFRIMDFAPIMVLEWTIDWVIGNVVSPCYNVSLCPVSHSPKGVKDKGKVQQQPCWWKVFVVFRDSRLGTDFDYSWTKLTATDGLLRYWMSDRPFFPLATDSLPVHPTQLWLKDTWRMAIHKHYVLLRFPPGASHAMRTVT